MLVLASSNLAWLILINVFTSVLFLFVHLLKNIALIAKEGSADMRVFDKDNGYDLYPCCSDPKSHLLKLFLEIIIQLNASRAEEYLCPDFEFKRLLLDMGTPRV